MKEEKRFYPKNKLRECSTCISQDNKNYDYPCLCCIAKKDSYGVEYFTHWYPIRSKYSRVIKNSDIDEMKKLCNVLIAYITKSCTPESIREQIEKIEEIKFILENKTNDHFNI